MVSDTQSDVQANHVDTFKRDLCYLLSCMKFDGSNFSVVEEDQLIPAWTGYNITTISVEVLVKMLSDIDR